MAFLVARTALEDGHDVACFLAGDAVQLLREPTLDAVVGVGTGRLREHVDALVAGGVRYYLCGMSSQAVRPVPFAPATLRAYLSKWRRRASSCA